MTIRAVLFDIGGVLMDSPFNAFLAYEQRVGLPAGSVVRINSTDPHTNAWARHERGELDAEGFVRAFDAEGAALGLQVDGRQVLAGLAVEARPSMVAAAHRCADRLLTGLLTNDVRTGGEVAGGRLGDLPSRVDLVLQSSSAGVRKPEPRFYEIACERLAIDPAEAVFLDDLGINLKPARAMGMTTIKVVEPDEALAELEQVLGLPLR